jgi:hypothetical protein
MIFYFRISVHDNNIAVGHVMKSSKLIGWNNWDKLLIQKKFLIKYDSS